jgi:hypothetical protein
MVNLKFEILALYKNNRLLGKNVYTYRPIRGFLEKYLGKYVVAEAEQVSNWFRDRNFNQVRGVKCCASTQSVNWLTLTQMR